MTLPEPYYDTDGVLTYYTVEDYQDRCGKPDLVFLRSYINEAVARDEAMAFLRCAPLDFWFHPDKSKLPVVQHGQRLETRPYEGTVLVRAATQWNAEISAVVEARITEPREHTKTIMTEDGEYSKTTVVKKEIRPWSVVTQKIPYNVNRVEVYCTYSLYIVKRQLCFGEKVDSAGDGGDSTVASEGSPEWAEVRMAEGLCVRDDEDQSYRMLNGELQWRIGYGMWARSSVSWPNVKTTGKWRVVAGGR